MRKLRIHVEAEPSKAAHDGIDALFLDDWLRSLIRAFASSTGDAPLKILSVKAGSIDIVTASDDDYMGAFVDDLRKASSDPRAGAVSRQVRSFVDLVPSDSDQVFELLDGNDNPVETIRIRAREVSQRSRPLASAEIRSFSCTVERVDIDPRRLTLYDRERSRTVAVSCSAAQSQRALALTDSDTPIIATLASSSGRAIDRTHRLLDLSSADEHHERQAKITDAQDRFSGREYRSRFPERFSRPVK